MLQRNSQREAISFKISLIDCSIRSLFRIFHRSDLFRRANRICNITGERISWLEWRNHYSHAGWVRSALQASSGRTRSGILHVKKQTSRIYSTEFCWSSAKDKIGELGGSRSPLAFGLAVGAFPTASMINAGDNESTEIHILEHRLRVANIKKNAIAKYTHALIKISLLPSSRWLSEV